MRKRVGKKRTSAHHRIGTRKTEEPEPPVPGEVGDPVEVKGEAYLLLLRKTVSLPEELWALPKGQGD